MTPFMRSLTFGVLFSLAATAAPGADGPAEPAVLPQMSIAVPVANDFPSPEIVFSVRNSGTQPIDVNRVFTPGSELVWNGPRGITWKNGSGTTHAADSVSVAAGMETIVDRFPIKTIYLKIAAGAENKGVQLLDGDLFRLTWMVDGKPSNELILRYSELK